MKITANAPRKNDVYLLIISLFIGGILATVLNGMFHTFVHDMFNIGADERGGLEFPRELPGLLATLIIGLLFFMGETKLIAFATILTAAGLFGLGFAPNKYVMIFFMFLWSSGEHIRMILIEPVALDVIRSNKRGTVLGLMNGLRSAGVILGTLLIWFLMTKLNFEYKTMFTGASVLAIVAAAAYFQLKPQQQSAANKVKFKFVLKKKYKTYYILAILFGLRKQLFLVFAPWLLITKFERGPGDIAILYGTAAAIGIFVKPLLGRLLDKFGERKVLTADAGMIVILSAIYGLAPVLLPAKTALIVLYICYITDELLFSLRTGRTTYLYKIADSKEDITPTLSMGISLEHIISMTGPFLAGMAWKYVSFYVVFIIAATVGVITAAVSWFMIPSPEKLEQIQEETITLQNSNKEKEELLT